MSDFCCGGCNKGDNTPQTKATLEFTLPGSNYDFQLAQCGRDLNDIVRGILDSTRASLKHGADWYGLKADGPVCGALERLREQILEGYGSIEQRLGK